MALKLIISPIALAAGEYEGLISLNLWTSIFTLVNLIILFLVAKKYLFGRVQKMIETRQGEIDNMYDDAGKSKKDAEALKADYEEKLKSAREESEEMMRNSVRNAKLKEEEILKNARDEASKSMKRAAEQIELERKAAVNSIKNDVSGIAIDIAEKVLERDINKQEHAEMIDSFIEHLGDDDNKGDSND